MSSIFYDASVLYQLDWYDSARKIFSYAITLFNPLLFFLSPLAFISLFVTYDDDKTRHRRLFVIIYTYTILACLIPYKQIFPYYIQVTLPAFIAFYAAFFTWLYAIFKPERTLHLSISLFTFWLYLLACILAIFYIVNALDLPGIYVLLSTVPLILGVYITYHACMKDMSGLFLNTIFAIIITAGYLCPYKLFFDKMVISDNTYQVANLYAMNQLLQDGSDYVAGIDLIYNRRQPIDGLPF